MSQDFPFKHFLQNQVTSRKDSIDLSKSFKNPFTLSDHIAVPTKNQQSSSIDEVELLREEILKELKNHIPQQKFDAYFKNTLIIEEITAKSVIFNVPSEFIKGLIIKAYMDPIKTSVQAILGKSFEVIINIAGQISDNNKGRDISNYNDENASHPIIKVPKFPKIETKKYKSPQDVKFSLELTPTKEDLISKVESQVINHLNPEEPGYLIDPSKTFKNFIVGPSNQLAVATTAAVAKEPGKKGQYPSLYLHSNSGLGKTHLLHAIANEIKENYPHLAICIITGREFMKEMVKFIQLKKLDQFQKKYSQSIDILMIDDIHELKNKFGTQDEFFHIFNELHSKGKQLIFTSDKPPKEIDGLEERLKTRLQWGLVIDIQRPDIETRMAILGKKAKEFDMYIPEDVLYLIASSISSSVREMEGALIRIFNYSDILQVEIDCEMVRELLRLKPDTVEKKIDLEDITRATSHYFKIPQADLKSRSRSKEIVHARHISMYLGRKLINATLKDIAHYYGGRDHTSIIHGINKISERVSMDKVLSKQITSIENQL